VTVLRETTPLNSDDIIALINKRC